jgi:hypothetical protein
MLLALLLSSAVATANAQAAPRAAAPSVCDLHTTERIVAVGDVHGAYAEFAGVLRRAGLIDAKERWTGRRAVLVQTGDVVDRGAESRRALDLLRRLEREAARAGGRVYALLGNHEVMRMIWDWRYVSPEEIQAFTNGASADLRERAYTISAAEAERAAAAQQTAFDAPAFRDRFMKAIPLGFIEMRYAFGPMGEYGQWLRERPAVVKINGIVFVHGGVSATSAELGCEGINAALRSELAINAPSADQVAAMLSSSPTGPLWYRGLAEEPEPEIASDVTTILAALGARAMVVGHTIPDDFRMRTRFGGRVIQIDTGMLGGRFYPGGVASALEIQGETMTAIYPGGRERLSTPALTTR